MSPVRNPIMRKNEMVKVETLPPKLMKKGLKEKILKICEGNDINFMAIF